MRIHLLLLCFLAVSAGAGCERSQPVRPSIDAGALTTVELRVEGMVCEACEETIGEKVGAMAGVESCTASHTEKNAVVRYDPGQTSPQVIAEAIGALGYKAVLK